MSGEPELSTASVGRYVASADRPPPWTTLHLWQIGRVPLIKPVSVFRQAGPPLVADSNATLVKVFLAWLARIEALPGFVAFQKTPVGLAA